MWGVCIIIRLSKCQPQSGQEHLWSQELKMNDALCTIMIMHSTLWEAIKIFLLRVFFFKPILVSQEKVIWGFSRRLCVLNLPELSAKYFGILFMRASRSERGEWELAWKKEMERGFTFALHQGSLTWPNYLLLHFSILKVYLVHEFS